MKTLITGLFLLVLTVAGWAENVETLTLRAVPERDYVLRGGARELVFSVDINGVPLKRKSSAPLNLAVVLDRSGSMEGAKLEQAKQAACVVLNQLQANDVFSLIVFDDKVQVLVPAQHVENKEAIRRKIMSIEPGDSTAIYAGVKAGAIQVRKYLSKENINRVIFSLTN